MIYTCNVCHFTFKRSGDVESCPDCGKPAVREATDDEKNEYIKYRNELEKAQKQKKGAV